MPPWRKPLDVDRLADEAADVDFAIPLDELCGLRSEGTPVAGTVSGRVHFVREQGWPVAQLVLAGIATLECQRCMKPLQQPLEVRSKVALISAEADAARVPPALEPVLAEGGRISIGELVTEELLLTLPIVPLHEYDDTCVPADAQAAAPGSETHRPFAGLAELLKR